MKYDLSTVPKEYMDQLNVISEPSDYLSKEEKRLMLENERKEKAARKKKEETVAQKNALKNRETNIGNRVLVPVTLAYRPFKTEALLVLDTGATMTALHQDVADRLHIMGFDHAGWAKVAGGNIVRTRRLKLSSVKLGPVERENLDVVIIEHKGPSSSYQGLLGMNFLRNLKYHINFDKHVIEWK